MDTRTRNLLGKVALMGAASHVDRKVSSTASKISSCLIILLIPFMIALDAGVIWLVKYLKLPSFIAGCTIIGSVFGIIIIAGLFSNKLRNSFWRIIKRR